MFPSLITRVAPTRKQKPADPDRNFLFSVPHALYTYSPYATLRIHQEIILLPCVHAYVSSIFPLSDGELERNALNITRRYIRILASIRPDRGYFSFFFSSPPSRRRSSSSLSDPFLQLRGDDDRDRADGLTQPCALDKRADERRREREEVGDQGEGRAMHLHRCKRESKM